MSPTPLYGECDDSYGTCSTVEDLDDSCGNTCTQVEDHIVPEKVACNAGENSKSSTIENSRKRKSAIKSPSTDIDEDFHSKLLKIEERKLEIEEEKLRLQREQLEAIKQIAFVLQSSQLDNILQL
ncbi:uncharacterized protein LOC123553648 isoform X2 [Mercenaria mercenaria]|uniref:uncharacterized protein LOC123553648 isoform X2 n=1 Tax=Mercenaria mercenaria TaxID=6596 RepID=UPI00234F2277|nr:uncharacterized protein LOC123553648 isoform X2 [Mercenaria mercenaria]